MNSDEQYKNELKFTDYYKAIVTNNHGVGLQDFLDEATTVFRRETVEEALNFIFDKSCILEFYKQTRNYQAVSNLHKLKDISRSLMDRDNIQPLQFLDYFS